MLSACLFCCLLAACPGPTPLPDNPARLLALRPARQPGAVRDDTLTLCLESAYPDGSPKETAMSEHLALTERALTLLETTRQSKSRNKSASGEAEHRVEKMLEFLMHSTMPNGQLPLWGESQPPVSATGLLLRGANLFKRDDMRWAATGGKKGKRPARLSIHFPQSGYAILRSGWDATASYLAVRNGGSAAKGHADANSFVLAAMGHPLIIDPGSVAAEKEAQQLARSVAHNAVTMDDRDTLRAPGKARFLTGSLMDVYDGENAGYEGDDTSARHRRRIVSVKPGLFVIVDDLTASAPRDWTLRFHLAPGEVSYRPASGQTTFAVAASALTSADPAQPQDPNAVNVARLPGGLHLWTLAPRRPGVEQGWIAVGKEQLLKTPRLSWTIPQAKTALFATLIIPFGTNPEFGQWSVSKASDGAILVSGPKDELFMNVVRIQPHSPEPADEQDGKPAALETDASVAFLRVGPVKPDAIFDTDPKTVHAFAVTDATRLNWRASSQNAVPIFTAARSVTLLEAAWIKDSLYVTVQGGEDIQLAPLTARWLIVNGGKRTPIPPNSPAIAIHP